MGNKQNLQNSHFVTTFLILIFHFLILTDSSHGMDASDVAMEVPDSHQTWETMNPHFEGLVRFCDSAKFGKRFVDFAIRDWQSLKSLDPASEEFPHGTRLTPAQYYNKALDLFKLDQHVTQDRLNAHFPDLSILDTPNHYFDQILVVWCDLLPQIDGLNGQRRHTLQLEEKSRLITFAWEIPAPQIMPRVRLMVQMQKSNGVDATKTVRALPFDQVKARLSAINVKAFLFPKEPQYFASQVMQELSRYSQEQREVFEQLLPLAGHSPDRPFFSGRMNEEKAISWLGDWINHDPKVLKKWLASYEKLLTGMDLVQKRDIQRLLPNWTPAQVHTFVKAVVVPFLHPTYKDDFGLGVEVGMKTEDYFSVVMIALENHTGGKHHKGDIHLWCEEAKPHFETLLLPTMVRQLSLVTMEYIKDVLCSALCMMPTTLEYRCKILKEKASILFNKTMPPFTKVGVIIGILNEDDTRILVEKLNVLEGILKMQDWVDKGMDVLHERLTYHILWMKSPNFEEILLDWKELFQKLPDLDKRVSLMGLIRECETRKDVSTLLNRVTTEYKGIIN